MYKRRAICTRRKNQRSPLSAYRGARNRTNDCWVIMTVRLRHSKKLPKLQVVLAITVSNVRVYLVPVVWASPSTTAYSDKVFYRIECTKYGAGACGLAYSGSLCLPLSDKQKNSLNLCANVRSSVLRRQRRHRRKHCSCRLML